MYALAYARCVDTPSCTKVLVFFHQHTEILEGDRVSVLDAIVSQGLASLEANLLHSQTLAVGVELRELFGDGGLDGLDLDISG